MVTRKQILETALRYADVPEGSAAHGYLVDTYNSIRPLPRGYKVKYTDPWCAVYVSAIMKLAGMSNFPHECGVFEMKKKFEKSNEEYEFSAKTKLVLPADLIFFKHSHVGFVLHFGATKVFTLEGNACDKVMRRTYDISDPSIMGYGIIEMPLDAVVSEVVAGKWGNGMDRRNRLRAAGYQYEEVQADVNLRLRGL